MKAPKIHALIQFKVITVTAEGVTRSTSSGIVIETAKGGLKVANSQHPQGKWIALENYIKTL